MIYPSVTDLAGEGVPVALTCPVLGVSEQAYFKWRANPVTQRGWNDAHLIHAARDVHHDDPESATSSLSGACTPAATG